MLINGSQATGLSPLDRGLAYGDGVFRTIECGFGEPKWWAYHYACLVRDALRLGLPAPEEALLHAELQQVASSYPRAVVKLILTRGLGQRGYALPDQVAPTRIVLAQPWSGYPLIWRQGITVRLCDLRLALQPCLAGIKHLNRLENVMARAEWSDTHIHEGLLRDQEGFVIEGTMTNLFLVRQGQLITPLLDRCGVSGVLRAWMNEHYAVREQRVTLEEIITADAVCLGNSLTGPCQVRELLEVRTWEASPLIQKMREAFEG